MNTIARTLERTEAVVDLLGRGVEVLFFATVCMALGCIAILTVAFTYGAIHPGDDFDFGGGRGGVEGGVEGGGGRGGVGGDVIVVPMHHF